VITDVSLTSLRGFAVYCLIVTLYAFALITFRFLVLHTAKWYYIVLVGRQNLAITVDN